MPATLGGSATRSGPQARKVQAIRVKADAGRGGRGRVANPADTYLQGDDADSWNNH